MQEGVKSEKDVGLFGIGYLLDKVVTQLPKGLKIGDRTPAVVAQSLKKHLEATAPPELDFADLITAIEQTEEDDVPLAAAKLLQKFLKANFTLAELEKIDSEGRSDRREAEQVLGFVLNEALHVTPSKEGSSVVYLHVMALASRGAEESMRLVFEGLHILAERLQSHQSFKEVAEIKASSYLVAQNPNIFRKLGFTVDNEEFWKASVSTKDFIEKYKK